MNIRAAENVSPAAIYAQSLEARQALNANDLEGAWQAAQKTEAMSETALQSRKLDAEPQLPLALGAAYEVKAQVLDKQGKRSEAIQLLQHALQRWQHSSITSRLTKNLNLFTLEGKRAPAIQAARWLGARRTSILIPGKVTLLFFWAHWCSDCKAEAPVLKRLAADYGKRGLSIIGPTQLYGYTATEEHASPAIEMPYIERVFSRYYQDIPGIAVPVSEKAFEVYGASTTPTIVLVDGRGIVRLFHPGAMSEADLRSALDKLYRT